MITNKREIDFDRQFNKQQKRKSVRNIFIAILSLVMIGLFGGAIVEQVQRLDSNGAPALPLCCGSIVALLIVVYIFTALADRAKNA
jgi:uncharacterized membrane protein